MSVNFRGILDSSTLRGITEATETAQRVARQSRELYGSATALVDLAKVSALTEGTQSDIQNLANLGQLPELKSPAVGPHLVSDLASQIEQSLALGANLNSKLGQTLTSLAGLGEQFETIGSITSEVESSIARMGLTLTIEEVLKHFEISGLLGTSQIIEEYGALGLVRGLAEQLGALAPLAELGLDTGPSSLDADFFRAPLTPNGHEEEEAEERHSPYLSARVVTRTRVLLRTEGFDGALDEFESAHHRYDNGEAKEAMADALKAFESTLKTICDLRGWPYAKNATANRLIDTVFANGLVPPALQSQFAALRSLLESGLPTVSNPVRHGQGRVVVVTPDYVAAYALHLCAANIVFLVDCYSALP